MAEVMILANSDVGLYKFRKELIEELVKTHHVVLVSPGKDYVQELRDLGCDFLLLEFDRHGRKLWEEARLYGAYQKVLGEYRPDVVLTYTIKPNIYGGSACRRKGIPYIANITGLGTAMARRSLLQRGLLLLYRFALHKADCVFFQNEENQRFMVKNKVISGYSEILPGSGVNLRQYQPLPYPPESRREFLFLSRIMREKGIDQYLEAASEIKKRHPDTVFHVCGDCEQPYEDILNRYERQGIILYHGPVKDTAAIYRKVFCLIHPTYYPEGLSNVILESCACQRPVITTNRSGCREVVEDGVNGFLVEERNSQDLVQTIEKFLKLSHEQRKQMGENARRKVEAGFDRQIVVEAYRKRIRFAMGAEDEL